MDLQDVDQQRFGQVAAAAWNAQRATKAKKTWTTWKDWCAPFRKQARGLTHEQMMAQVVDMRKQFYAWRH